MAQIASALDRLATADPLVGPLARLQAVALAAADEPGWETGVPELTDPAGATRADDLPLLHGRTLAVDADRQRGLLRRLAATLRELGSAEAGPLAALFGSASFDPLEPLRASVIQDGPAVEAIAERAGVDDAVLAVVIQVAALPLLLACGRRAAPVVEAAAWPHGACPVCAAWPTLAEVRGLVRDLVLRCGRCASGWPFEHGRCPSCGSDDQGAQGYFAAERERESRKAVTCDTCHGYLKTLATLGPLTPAELLLRDLHSLELDLTALDHGYARPEAPGRALSVRVEPLPRGRGDGRRWWS
jgi:FdhE protein